MKKIGYKFLLLLFFVHSFTLFSQEISISGRVVVKNKKHNGKVKKKGISTIYLSDGEQIFKTNKSGQFKAKINANSPFFIILPSGYKMTDKAWYISKPKDGDKINFELEKAHIANKFQFLAVGDVQVGSPEEMNMADFSFFREVANTKNYDFALYLGDLVNDTPELFNPLLKAIKSTNKPYRAVYGNHDWKHGAAHEEQDKPYEAKFGPKNYAFQHGDVLFITLNSIFPVGKYGYKGIYKPETLHFVKNVINQVAQKNQLLVINQHIPLRWMENKDQLLDLLNIDNEVLILSGHTHSISRNFYKRNGRSDIQELVCGAVSGNWWTGQKNWEGLPLALMKGGAPRGYFTITINHTDYKIKYKGIGLDKHKQMSAWFGALPQESVPNTLDTDNQQFLLNFYAGSAKTSIEVYDANQSFLGRMEQIKIQDPYIQRIKKLQKEHLYPNKLSKKSPYLGVPSAHIWKMDLSKIEKFNFNTLKIKVHDPYLEDFEYTLNFWKR